MISDHVDASLHPLYRKSYSIQTPAQTELIEEIKRWLYLGATGGFIWGIPRCGKTVAIQALERSLTTRAGQPIPVFIYNAKTFHMTTDNKHWHALLLGFGHAFASKGRAIDKYQRLIGLLAESATVNERNQVVVVVDEAQKWRRLEYEFMVDLGNDLALHNINLSVLLFGTTELREQAQHLTRDLTGHIRGRFFLREIHYRGLRSKADIAAALRQFDSVLVWPQEEPKSFTEYFLPEAYEQNFRLEDLAGYFWHVFQDERQRHGLTDWPLYYFIATVELLLLDYLPSMKPQACDVRTVAAAFAMSAV
ncbi:ATP-binding protein [Salinisphaera aquimarina]|uniref:ATP-binding protein n=1 Tax=Salinisphaera aquimarina TaxID=2094031 RepID=A0ABV7ES43_9GAMM